MVELPFLYAYLLQRMQNLFHYLFQRPTRELYEWAVNLELVYCWFHCYQLGKVDRDQLISKFFRQVLK